MLDFAERSPYRNFFNWCLMPTVDAAPQARQWIATYQSADACFTYSDWAGKVLQQQSGGKINYLGSAPPSAHPAYSPSDDKDAVKKSLGMDPDWKIVGTVMRNQRRKLYPDLFEAFRLLLNKVDNDPSYKLYCHTSYPDMDGIYQNFYNNIIYHPEYYLHMYVQKKISLLFHVQRCYSPISFYW